MRYALGIWERPRPGDDTDAGELFARLIEQLERDEASVPAAPLARFARTLLNRLPDLQVWATADGMRVAASVEEERVEQLVAEVAALARTHGMVCYDAQRESRIA